MSWEFGIDYAWGGPPPVAALRAARVRFVGRYLSYDQSKNLTARERKLYAAAGIGLELAWETLAERALAGAGAGRSDAINAIAQCKRLGFPTTPVVHLAVDFEAQGPEIEDYFRGARNVLGEQTGAYGGHAAIAHLFDAGLISHGWQTYAWSSGAWDPRARVRQYSNGHTIAGVQCDLDVRLDGRPYWPADELRWEREYDRLRHNRSPLARARMRVLRHAMLKRRRVIYKLAAPAGQDGWRLRNRHARYEALLERTE